MQPTASQERPCRIFSLNEKSAEYVDEPDESQEAEQVEAFTRKLEGRMARRDIEKRDFLLVGLRRDQFLTPDHKDFPFRTLQDAIEAVLSDTDAFVATPSNCRMAILLEGWTSAVRDIFFDALLSELEERDPRAKAIIREALSAIVVPQGRPFPTAQQFVSYTLDYCFKTRQTRGEKS